MATQEEWESGLMCEDEEIVRMYGLVVGIDPGISGAIAILDSKGDAVDVYDMPVADGLVSGGLLYRSLKDRLIRLVVVEKVNAKPPKKDKHGKQRSAGTASMFKFGDSVGAVRGVVGALGVPLAWAPPGVWKRHHRLIGKDKEASRRLAMEKYPRMAEKLARKKDSGRAEALLIAEYGRHKDGHV